MAAAEADSFLTAPGSQPHSAPPEIVGEEEAAGSIPALGSVAGPGHCCPLRMLAEPARIARRAVLAVSAWILAGRPYQ